MEIIKYKQLFKWLLFGCIVITTTACSKSEPEPVPKPETVLKPESKQALLLVEQTKNSCQFRFHFPASNKTENWFSLPECMSEKDGLAFDTDKHRAFLLQKGKFFKIELQRDAKPIYFSDAYTPPSEKNVATTKTWIDKASGNLRVAYLIMEPRDEPSNSESGWLQKTFPMITETRSPYADGYTSVALVAELAADGKWQELTARLTTTGAGETLGIDVVSSFMIKSETTFSLDDLLMKATCSHQRDCVSDQIKLSKKVSDWVKEKYKSGDESEQQNISYIPMGDADGFLAGVAFGDSYHWDAPLYYCQGNADNRCETHDEILLEASQIGISVQSNYALITNEYYGTSAQLFKSGSKNPITTFKPDTVVVWMPVVPW